LTDSKDATYLTTLAAACAEAGDFENAIKWQQEAQRTYSENDQRQWGFLVDLYRSGKPYRDLPN